MRNASTSPSSFAPSADSVAVRRATHPSTKSSARATDESVTSVATATSRSNEAAVRAATPTASVARNSVIQPAGPSLADGSRRRARASQTFSVRPAVRPTSQPAPRGRGGGTPDAPPAPAEPDRPPKHGQEQQRAAEPRQRAGLGAQRGQRAPRSPHRRSASEHPEEKYARRRAPVFHVVMRQD